MTRNVAGAVRRRSGAAVLAVMALAVVGTVFVTGAGARAAAQSGATTYKDPAGDAQGGPDVRGVDITGDAATGTMTVALTLTAYPLTSPVGLVQDALIWLDTDKNSATGDPEDGTEYALQAWVDSTGRWWIVPRWNGSKWEGTPQSATQSFTRMHSASQDMDILTWTLNASDLGGATSFRFYVVAGTWSDAEDKYTVRDDAPDSGWWEYDISATTPTPPATPPATPPSASKVALMISAPTTSPKAALAGKRFTVTFRVDFEKVSQVTSISIATGEVTTGTMVMWEPVDGGKMVCDPSVAGKAIAHTESFKNGQARLSFVIPKTATGKLLKVKVKITATDAKSGKTLTASKIATFRVR